MKNRYNSEPADGGTKTKTCEFIAIVGLQGFFPLKGQAAVGVGSLEASTSERKRLAKL